MDTLYIDFSCKNNYMKVKTLNISKLLKVYQYLSDNDTEQSCEEFVLKISVE